MIDFFSSAKVLTSSLTEIFNSGVNVGMGTFDFNSLFALIRGGV